MFNGEDLDGWYTFIRGRGKDVDPKNVFTVQNGEIRISGEEYGCITTDAEYENYHLKVDFKWGDETFAPRKTRARDGGILLHSTGVDGGYYDVWMYSIECQLIEEGSGDFLVVGDKSEDFAISSPVADEKQGGSYIYKEGGDLQTIHGGRINWYGRSPQWKDVLGFRGDQDVENAIGEWNTIECIAQGDSISIILNDVLVNKTFNVKPTKGKIQIQSEGAEMFVKNISLKSLD